MLDFIPLALDKLESIKDTTLFYPCSGNDFQVPIEIFAPYVTDFWFVDRGYFSTGHKDTRHYGGDVSAAKQTPLLSKHPQYTFIAKEIKGLPDWQRYNFEIDPCVLTEEYIHIQSGKIIRIHRRRGYGFSAFRNEPAIGQLGVFFYRGDSEGEGGSGNLWLNKEHLNEIFDKIIDRGYLVIDGSDGRSYRKTTGIYREFTKHAWGNLPRDPVELIKSMQSFRDPKGRWFECIGYAGMKYGPTLIWQLYK